jgi:uncharacterized protein YkwD
VSLHCLKRRLSLLLLTAMAPLVIGSSSLTSNLDARLIAAHNREREAMSLPPLRWDDGLARSAKLWADHLAEEGSFHHAPERSFDPEGENLWAGTSGYYSAEAMVAAWVREKRMFKPGVFPDNSTTGRVADVGHYTQIIWRNTDAVGCALATGKRDDVLVCRYSQAGNYVGERPI